MYLTTFICILPSIASLPLGEREQELEDDGSSDIKFQRRNNKALRFFGLLPTGGELTNQLARTEPHKVSSHYPNSPIYYIRLPPSPYVFVPGLGYVSPPQTSGFAAYNPLINLPVDFVSNGKPTSVYQWSPHTSPVPLIPAPTPAPTTTTTTTQRPYKPKPKPDSSVTNLKGPYLFNGKPSSIFIMRNPYATLLNDALQSFYP